MTDDRAGDAPAQLHLEFNGEAREDSRTRPHFSETVTGVNSQNLMPDSLSGSANSTPDAALAFLSSISYSLTLWQVADDPRQVNARCPPPIGKAVSLRLRGIELNPLRKTVLPCRLTFLPPQIYGLNLAGSRTVLMGNCRLDLNASL